MIRQVIKQFTVIFSPLLFNSSMKSKNTVYVLILSVAIVWGVIFYKIFSGMPEEEVVGSSAGMTNRLEYFNLVDHRNDDFDRSESLWDPFSGLSANKPEEQVVVQAAYSGIATNVRIPEVPPLNWSGIIYRGYVVNPVNKQKVALITVNGKEAMLSEGESFSGLKLLKCGMDSIKVSYQKSVKYLSIK